MKTFAELRQDKAAGSMARKYNAKTKGGNNLPYFAMLKLFLDETKSMKEIAEADGVGETVMRERYREYFAPVIDPEHERSRRQYLAAVRKSKTPKTQRQLTRLNGSSHLSEA